ncbi:MAG: hypothetical protein R3325_01580 [Thermoanaerobaculia bacterium]|nr:hypothetical protein [Thermoanaerobaculia bacterium]
MGLLVALALAGCSANRLRRQAQEAERLEQWDLAVQRYLELVAENPESTEFRTGLLRAKIQASQEHFARARALQEAGVYEQALVEFRQAVELDPTNQYAQVEYEKLRNQIAQYRESDGRPESLDEMKSRARSSRPQPPILDPRSDAPISLSFPKQVSIFQIYQSLGKAFGINILFDPKLRDQQVSIELQDVVAQDALEILMRTANHFYKVLDEHTLIVAEDNPQNRRNYEDLVIQTFFLSNAEVKDVMTMLRSLVGAKNIAANDQLNAIVLRDTADKVKVAERIILTNDKSRGEVVIDVDLLQINTSKMRELGISLSDYQVTQSVEPNPIPVSEVEFINQANWMLNLPAFIYDFVKNSSETELLANPQLRISDGEQATLHIGDRVPIPVTTFNTAQTVGGNIVPITSFQYQDIGIRLDLLPRLHHNREISLELTVEVSQISGFVPAGAGASQPIIGTRTIESTIRLQDGETNFLAGLLQTDKTDTDTGIPGLSEIPILGRLFSKKSTDRQRTDLVLTLTPHIVRTPDITEEDLMPIWVGTEANITFRGGSPRVESEVEGPFDEGSGQDAERIREMIRRRIQNLPRGLREGEAEEPQEEDQGQQLVPSAGAPADVFRRRDSEPEPEEDDDDGDGGPRPVSLIFLPEEEGEAVSATGDLAVPAQPPMPGEEPDPAEPDVRLGLEPAAVAVAPGESFELRLVAVAARPVAHLPVTLRFDPQVVRVVEVAAGDFPGGAEVLADLGRPGVAVIGASRSDGGAAPAGAGVLARLTVRALAPGDAALTIEPGEPLGAGLEPLSSARRRPPSVTVVGAPEAAGGGG